MTDPDTHAAIHGSCAPDFTGVRDAFERNFTMGHEVGAAVAVWVDGALVVNLWGGSADAAGIRPWRQNTLSTILSGTTALTATCVHQLADRGELDLQAPVARYWPEFGQAGKGDITLAMVMSHRSGVIGPRVRMRWEDVADWDFVCEQLAAAEPRWTPGTAQGYHMTTFGFIVGEVFRRVTGRTVGHYLRTEIAEPLGADVHIGLSAADHRRCAEMINKPHIRDVLAKGGAPGDPTSLDEARGLFPRQLDTIVNVPAPSWDVGDPRTYSTADTANAWRNGLDATVLSLVLTVHTVGDHLRSGGSIISVITGNAAPGSPDAAVKAALSSWVAGQAGVFGARGITVNALAGGRGADPGYDGLSRTTPTFAAEVARLALFLTTPAARHITGPTLHVSRGALAHFG